MANLMTRRRPDGSPRRRRLTAGATALAALAALGVAYGTGPDVGSATAAAKVQSPAPGTITTVQTKFGKVLANSKGRTLYMLTADKNGKSSCSSSCLALWPAATGTPHHGAGVTAKLATTDKQGGGKIITADGHPLYTYSGDTGGAQTHGQNINTFGGRWYVLSPAGKPITKQPSNPSSPPSGGGY